MKQFRTHTYLKYFQFLLLLAIVLFNFSPASTGVAHAVNCYTLTLAASPPAGLVSFTTMPSPNCGAQYTEGTTVTVTANPVAGYLFGAWQGDMTGTSNSSNITMSANKSVTAILLADQWQNAINISNSLPYSTTVNTTLANYESTNEPQVINCAGAFIRGGKATIWYKYIPTANGPVSLDTLGSFQTAVNPSNGNVDPYDTYISVWTGTIDNDPSDGTPHLEACNDDIPGTGFVSQLNFQAVAGTTYYIQVAQYRGPATSTDDPYYTGGTLSFHAHKLNIDVNIGGASMGNYYVPSGSDKKVDYPVSGGPVKIADTTGGSVVSAIRLQSFANNTLYSFVETMGVPSGLLSYKYYFPTYNNTWAPLNSQLRFANINDTDINVKVTIGGTSWTYPVPAHSERREYLAVSGGPVIIESTDPTKDIIAAIRLQSLDVNTNLLYSFAETMGIPAEQLSYKYYFPTYNNTWAPLNSQLRFANINDTDINVKVTIGSTSWTYPVPAHSERREYLAVSGGPVTIESTDPTKDIIAAIRLQSFAANNTLYSFVETMGVPSGLLSYKYYFPTYNNTWAPLNSQLRFANINDTDINVKVTIGGTSWTYPVPAHSERREYLAVSGGPVIIESTDPTKDIIAAIRLQSLDANTNLLYSFAETMGIPAEQLSSTNYFSTYNNTWAPLNSQVRFGVP